MNQKEQRELFIKEIRPYVEKKVKEVFDDLRRILSYKYSTQFKCKCGKESSVSFPEANINWIIKELTQSIENTKEMK